MVITIKCNKGFVKVSLCKGVSNAKIPVVLSSSVF